VKVKPPPHVLWPAVIVGALAVHVVASLVTVWIATSNPSYAVEEDYYQKALAWDASRDQKRHNTALGWRLDAEVTAAASTGGDPTLAVRLVDRDGRPLDGATVAVAAFHNARADEILRAELAAKGDGLYSCGLAMRRSGVWELRFTVDRGGERFTHTVTRHVNLGVR
jgi:nitrogen fixation protein FixH